MREEGMYPCHCRGQPEVGEASSLGRLHLATSHIRQSLGDPVVGLLQSGHEKVSANGQQRKFGLDQRSPVREQTLGGGQESIKTNGIMAACGGSLLFLG